MRSASNHSRPAQREAGCGGGRDRFIRRGAGVIGVTVERRPVLRSGSASLIPARSEHPNQAGRRDTGDKQASTHGNRRPSATCHVVPPSRNRRRPPRASRRSHPSRVLDGCATLDVVEVKSDRPRVSQETASVTRSGSAQSGPRWPAPRRIRLASGRCLEKAHGRLVTRPAGEVGGCAAVVAAGRRVSPVLEKHADDLIVSVLRREHDGR